MKRKLIVTSTCFVVGLLAITMVTLSLLMSLIKKPELLSTARIAHAVGKSLEALKRNGELDPGNDHPNLSKEFPSLSAAVIGKAKQKGLHVNAVQGMTPGSREYKSAITQQTTRSAKPLAALAWHRPDAGSGNPRLTKHEQLVYELLSMQSGNATDEAKRSVVIKILEVQHKDGGWSSVPGMPSDPCATGQALYALQESGMLHPEAPDSQHGLFYLLNCQKADGSWFPSGSRLRVENAFVDDSPERKAIESETTNWASLALLEALPDKNPDEK